MAKKSKNVLIAEEILETAKKLGYTIKVERSILKITHVRKPDEYPDVNDWFVYCDSTYYGILSKLPTTSPGSTWGTDGSGVGAVSAMNSGVFTMNKSGGSKLVLNAIKKMIA